MQPVIYRSRNYDIIIAFLLRQELCQTYKYKYECNLVENLPTHWEAKEENRETNENTLVL